MRTEAEIKARIKTIEKARKKCVDQSHFLTQLSELSWVQGESEWNL